MICSRPYFFRSLTSQRVTHILRHILVSVHELHEILTSKDPIQIFLVHKEVELQQHWSQGRVLALNDLPSSKADAKCLQSKWTHRQASLLKPYSSSIAINPGKFKKVR